MTATKDAVAGQERTLIIRVDTGSPERPESRKPTIADVTAIAWSWEGVEKVECLVLGETTLKTMLEEFRKVYDEAVVVAGHGIRQRDLPLINDAMLELGMPPLSPKVTSDTAEDSRSAGALFN